MVKDTFGIEECIDMYNAIEERHYKVGIYCEIYLGREYLRMCQEHKGLPIRPRNDKRYKKPSKPNLAFIECFRKISDIRGTWGLHSRND